VLRAAPAQRPTTESLPSPGCLAGCKKLESKGGPPQGASNRYKVLVSDGERAVPCILATQLAGLGASGQLAEGTVVDITECICNAMENKA
jgi:hypothetical protein